MEINSTVMNLRYTEVLPMPSSPLEEKASRRRPAVANLVGQISDDPVLMENATQRGEISPEELARRAAQGCLASFEQLVLRFEAQIFNFLHVLTRHRQDAEDLTQETFCRAWRSLHRYNPSLTFAPWVFAIARHTAASHFRGAKTYEELPEDAGVVEENPANLLASKDDSSALWLMARALKPKLWEVLWFRYAEGFSTAETARAMRTNQIHVKVLLHRARGEMAKRLLARGYDRATAGDRVQLGHKKSEL